MSQPVDPSVWDYTMVQLFAQLAELPCVWRDQERPFVDAYQNALVLLSVSSVSAIGIDERRIELDAAKLASVPPAELEPTQTGLRRVVLQVQVDAYDQDARNRARFFLERIRTRLRRPSSESALDGIETGLIDIAPIVVIGNVVDGRVYSRATMDVNLHVSVNERDQAFGRIASMAGTGEYTDHAGIVVKTEPFTLQLELLGD